MKNIIFQSLCGAALLALTAVEVCGEPNLPFVNGLFTDNMILQRDVPCPIWGWTAPGSKVTVTLGEQAVTALAAADGRWLATLAPQPAGGPHTIAISGSQKLSLKNVLFGDVWICSGQSNMEMGIDSANQYLNELPWASADRIRLYWVKGNSSFVPEATVSGAWTVASVDTLLNMKKPFASSGFSAIAWMFARKVHKETGVPIGMIECAVGNTFIQSWSTVASLRLEQKYGDKFDCLTYYEKELIDWAKASDPAYVQTESWRSLEFDDSSWATMKLPQGGVKTALSRFNGIVWFRRRVEVPATLAGQDLWLNLGPVQNQSMLWFNGVFVGSEDARRRDHSCLVSGKLVKAGENVIAVRVMGDGSFSGKTEQLQLRPMNATGEPIALAGPWKFQPSTPANKLSSKKKRFAKVWVPGGLYQGMVAPLAPFAIKGVLWYQGENNVGQVEYEKALTVLIRDWRTTFGQGDFPFYLVQLAGFGPLPAQPGSSFWATTREIQARIARTVPNSGLAVAMDRGDIYDIHPPHKRDVSERLAAVALAKTYQKNIPFEGPTFREMKVESGRIRIHFDHAEGLKSLGSRPTGFAIAGADKKFVWAQALMDGTTVIVSAPEVAEPVAVRYGWGDNALCNLYNKFDFPAVPFRTDVW
jgi:sialate O-acetylesterase